MRKKYLSALLFGALLVTSAGTFTSCKDYDDDIKNLQEQIDVIKTDLASLTETVNNLDGVKDMSFADGKLVIETGKGKKVEVDIPSASGITKVELKDNVLYVNDEPQGEVVIPEDELVKVEVKEDGKLYINDEVQDLEIGSKVVMVDNGDYYTMTIDGKESYNLPKYNAAVNISKLSLLKKELTFGPNTGEAVSPTIINPILWGFSETATDDMKNWKGPKGPVAANQIMVGQIAVADDAIEVSPASIDLTTMELKLVDSKGNVAPVKVTPVANSGLAVDNSRAASTDGKWSLAIEMTEDVNKDNIYSYFYNLDPNNRGYKLYALQVNGIVMTGYDIAVKVDDDNTATAAVSGNLSGDNGAKFARDTDFPLDDITLDGGERKIAVKLKAGKTTTYTYSDADCYDSYISFEGTNKAHADKLGIKAEGMKITVPSSAVNLSTGDELWATLNILNVDGTTNSNTQLCINTTGSATEDEVELGTTSVKVMPTTTTIKIDLTKAIEGMTDAQIEDVDKLTHIKVEEITGQDILEGEVDIKYYTAKDKELVDNATSGKETYTDLRQISYAKINIDNKLTDKIKAGDYKLIMTMYNEPNVASGNTTASEVRKVTIPVSISMPTFDELFPKSAAWNDNTAKLIADVDGTANLMTLYTDKTGVTGGAKFTEATVKQGTNGAIGTYSDNNVITLTETAVDANSNTFKALTASVKYTYNNITLESGNFDVQMITGLNGGKFVYYNENGEAADLTINAASGSFDGFVAADSDTKKSGLAFVYGGKDYSFEYGNKVGVFTLDYVGKTFGNVEITFDGQQGSNAEAYFEAYGKLVIEGLAPGNYTTNMTVTYLKASQGVDGDDTDNDPTYVKESFTVPVKVNF